MNKNILIRNLTKEQNERLLLLQKKFGVKTNTQALLLLLRYCVFLDDDLATLIGLYTMLGKESFAAYEEMKKAGLNTANIETIVIVAAQKCSKLEWLLNRRKGKK